MWNELRTFTVIYVHTANTIGNTKISYDFYLMFRCDVIVIFHFTVAKHHAKRDGWMDQCRSNKTNIGFTGWISIFLSDFDKTLWLLLLDRNLSIIKATKSVVCDNLKKLIPSLDQNEFDFIHILVFVVVWMKLYCDSFSFDRKKNCLFTPKMTLIVTLGVIFAHSLFG